MTRARRSRKADGNGSRTAELQPMKVRPKAELQKILDQCRGNTVLAAMIGVINAEEFLFLEKLNEH